MMRWISIPREKITVRGTHPRNEQCFQGVHWLRHLPFFWRFYAPRAVIWVENKGVPYYVLYRSHPGEAVEHVGRSMWSINSSFVAVRIRSGPVNFSFFDKEGRPLFSLVESGKDLASLLSTTEVRKQYPHAKLI